MEFFRLIIIGIILVLVASCGDPRTSAQLRSPEEIQSITSTFTIEATRISDVYQALGPWDASSRDTLDTHETVVYWTNDGKQTNINFTLYCDAGFPNCWTTGEPSQMLYSGTTH